MLDLGLDIDAATMRLEESKQRLAVARAEILGTAWQAAVNGERWRLRTEIARRVRDVGQCLALFDDGRTGGDVHHLRSELLLVTETDVGAAHDGREPCRAGLLSHVGGVNR
jgi:hypothetical protein